MPEVKRKSKGRPKYCLYVDKSVDKNVYTVFEVYEKQNKIGFWHDANKPGEMPIVFEPLNQMRVIWSDAELLELERLGVL